MDTRNSNNYRNVTKKKIIRSKYGKIEIDVPKDCKSTFEPQVVKNLKKDISGIDDKIIAMYAKDFLQGRLRIYMALNALKVLFLTL